MKWFVSILKHEENFIFLQLSEHRSIINFTFGWWPWTTGEEFCINFCNCLNLRKKDNGDTPEFDLEITLA